jgi:hypothetical protein
VVERPWRNNGSQPVTQVSLLGHWSWTGDEGWLLLALLFVLLLLLLVIISDWMNE